MTYNNITIYAHYIKYVDFKLGAFHIIVRRAMDRSNPFMSSSVDKYRLVASHSQFN
jgi:hypothetical protein